MIYLSAAAADSLSQCFNPDELELLSAFLESLADNLALIAACGQQDDKRDEGKQNADG